ncbi:MAG: hypothetical protein Q7S59_10945 [Sulfurimonas sp.]|nr:hypothetical protein [Sulfurimonas sp.]
MSWFNFFETKIEKKHQFGRGINANLSPKEEDFFNKSYEAFERKEILDAYEYFFKSLENFTNGVSNQNVTTKKEDEKLHFEIFQGSAKITGYITNEHLYAESILTKKSGASVALKRYILERNYQFTYVNYFSNSEFLKLKLSHDNSTMSPQKVFFPLRELALNADFDKEYAKCEFSDTLIEDITHLSPLDEEELKIKYAFLKKWIDEVTEKIATFPPNDNAGMQAFSFLYLYFKIDYLLTPKYEIYHKMSRKIQEYSSDENSTIEAKNEELKEYLDVLKEMGFEEFKSNFYDAKYTFNPSDRTSNEEISIFISDSLSKIRWYKNNRYHQIIPTLYNYIAFHILYNYGLHPVTKALIHTLVEIQNPSFFAALGYPILYNEKTNNFAKKVIISKIEDIIEPFEERFKLLEPFGDKLNYTTLNEFSNSFYLQLQDLNFEEI